MKNKNIIEEEEMDEEVKKNTDKNIQIGHDALNEESDSESGSSSHSENEEEKEKENEEKEKKDEDVHAASDTFVFVQGKLIIHRRAKYTYYEESKEE